MSRSLSGFAGTHSSFSCPLRLDVGEDPPGVYVHRGYGSKEILRVRWTMEKLYKIVQCANAAYFAGEVEVAYKVFTDALYLFTRLDNKKASKSIFLRDFVVPSVPFNSFCS